jgi:hypothetical protein
MNYRSRPRRTWTDPWWKNGMMTVSDSDTDVRRELLEYLEYQRASVRSIVDGLNEDAWHTPVVASGWTIAGVVEHLGGAERHWFQEVVAGLQEDQRWGTRVARRTTRRGLSPAIARCRRCSATKPSASAPIFRPVRQPGKGPREGRAGARPRQGRTP